MAKIHIGKKIREVVDKSDLTIVGFAKEINLSRDGAYKIFAKDYIDTDQLKQISKVLKHDFFNYYSLELSEVKEPHEKIGFATKDDFETLKKMMESLAKKVDELSSKSETEKSYKTGGGKNSKKNK